MVIELSDTTQAVISRLLKAVNHYSMGMNKEGNTIIRELNRYLDGSGSLDGHYKL